MEDTAWRVTGFDAEGCQRDVRRGRAALGVDLPFDRGKAWWRIQHGG